MIRELQCTACYVCMENKREEVGWRRIGMTGGIFVSVGVCAPWIPLSWQCGRRGGSGGSPYGFVVTAVDDSAGAKFCVGERVNGCGASSRQGGVIARGIGIGLGLERLVASLSLCVGDSSLLSRQRFCLTDCWAWRDGDPFCLYLSSSSSRQQQQWLNLDYQQMERIFCGSFGWATHRRPFTPLAYLLEVNSTPSQHTATRFARAESVHDEVI